MLGVQSTQSIQPHQRSTTSHRSHPWRQPFLHQSSFSSRVSCATTIPPRGSSVTLYLAQLHAHIFFPHKSTQNTHKLLLLTQPLKQPLTESHYSSKEANTLLVFCTKIDFT